MTMKTCSQYTKHKPWSDLKSAAAFYVAKRGAQRFGFEPARGAVHIAFKGVLHRKPPGHFCREWEEDKCRTVKVSERHKL